ncbi:hypothetical protein CDD83_5054 [Cordyceps sp. RAO-2017]|nr:hypothetical protein CDD83_5054 [Cordyceps sp. RAO-2017]
MAKTPRFDAYTRTIARFYEPLILLGILGRSCTPRSTTNYISGSLAATRRRFLKNLAAVCDFTKGGATTTAIAVEDAAHCFRFWLATNHDSSAATATGFLRLVLAQLRDVCDLPDGPRLEESERALASAYAAFASPRLKKESKLLFKFAQRCREALEAQPDGRDADLITWLGRFEPARREDLLGLCQVAYESRHDAQARRVEKLGADAEDGSAPGTEVLAFRGLRHFIGRLAAHVRVVKELVGDARRVRPLLETFEVAAVSAPRCAARPRADGLTTLPGMLNRMLGSNGDSGRRAELLQQLQRLDQSLQLEAAVLAKYDDDCFAPRMHAEVQLLDHFHARRLAFVADDRFVACSKAACFCCRLYFRHHAARPVEPDSHGNLYLNWGLARLPGGSGDAGWLEQRRLLNKMIHDIRDVALERIAAFGAPGAPSPDSLSGITRSSGAAAAAAGSDDDDALLVSDDGTSHGDDWDRDPSGDDESGLDSDPSPLGGASLDDMAELLHAQTL